MYGGSAMASSVDAYIAGEADSSMLGSNTSWAGQVDGASEGDIVSGAHLENHGRGATYIWLGTIPLDTHPDGSALGEFEGHQPAWMTVSAGDVDGDGRGEVSFCNYAAQTVEHTVWIAKYYGTGVEEVDGTEPSGRRCTIRCRPNPFSTETVLEIQLHGPDYDRVEVCDTAGRVVRRLPLSGRFEAQSRDWVGRLRWDGSNDQHRPLPSGVYFARAARADQAHESPVVLKIVLMR